MFINHDHADIFVASFGQGTQTLLAFGGWAGSWELWAEPLGLLSRSWRTVAYDHRGSGATLAPVESISQAALVSDVLAVMDALEIAQCVIAAESAGAAVALQAALEQPSRFQGLVLVDALYYRPPTAEPSPFVMGLRHAYEATIAQFVDNCLTERDGEAVRRWGRQILLRTAQEAAIRLYQTQDGLDLRPHVRNIALPALILHGAQDRIVPVEAARWLASHMPNSRLHIIEGAGHVPTVTHPREVADAIHGAFAV